MREGFFGESTKSAEMAELVDKDEGGFSTLFAIKEMTAEAADLGHASVCQPCIQLIQTNQRSVSKHQQRQQQDKL